jgi:hypothetical protein
MRATTAVHRYFLTILPAVFLLTSSYRLYSFFTERSDIWWTPVPMRVPLDETHDRVQVYVRGAELDDLIASGRLRLTGDGGGAAVPLSAADVGMRFNNWDRVRAQRTSVAVMWAATAGVAAAFLYWGLMIVFKRPDLMAGGGTP